MAVPVLRDAEKDKYEHESKDVWNENSTAKSQGRLTQGMAGSPD